jgi:hypothetical protein
VIAQILFQLTSAVASVGRVKTSSHKNWPSDEEAKRSSLQKPMPAPIIGLQHPLSFYDAFAGGVR